MPLLLAFVGGAPSVEAQPEVVLDRWCIFELPHGTRHFCGYHASPSKAPGRVSSEILRFDPETMTGTTTSGRVYRLEGPPGEEEDTRTVRTSWLVVNGFRPEEAVDVQPTAFGRPLN